MHYVNSIQITMRRHRFAKGITLFLTSICYRPRRIYARGWRAACALMMGGQCLAIGAPRFTPVLLTSPHLCMSYNINHVKVSMQY
jgi:hypothetical protein